MTKESIRRKLGYKNQSKKPLLQEQVDEVVGQFLSQPTIQGLANGFRVSLAYEATLRWDDYEDMTFGDFIVTNDFVRVFLVDTKTDSMKSGQWATFAASTRSKSAYQLYRTPASFEALKRTQPRANCSVACYVSWRTRFADCKQVKNEISGIPEEPQTSLPPFGV